MILGNNYTSKHFIENDLIYSDWGGAGNISLSMRGLSKNNYILLSLLYIYLHLFISSLRPSNTLKRFVLRLNMGVVIFAIEILRMLDVTLDLHLVPLPQVK